MRLGARARRTRSAHAHFAVLRSSVLLRQRVSDSVMADSTPTTGPESAPRGISDTPLFVGLAGVSAAGAVAFSLYLILTHLRNYTEPVYQRFIVRIIFMVPVYATCSFLSLVAPHSSVYFDAFRDIFEVRQKTPSVCAARSPARSPIVD